MDIDNDTVKCEELRKKHNYTDTCFHVNWGVNICLNRFTSVTYICRTISRLFLIGIYNNILKFSIFWSPSLLLFSFPIFHSKHRVMDCMLTFTVLIWWEWHNDWVFFTITYRFSTLNYYLHFECSLTASYCHQSLE